MSFTPTFFPITSFSSTTSSAGIIDFYFACNDALAYDIAVCLNAWCFEANLAFNLTKGRRFLSGYDERALAERWSATPCRFWHAAPRCAFC